MVGCLVQRCKSLSSKTSDITFHRLPVKLTALDEYLKLSGHKNNAQNLGTKQLRICSTHFRDEDFFTVMNGQRRLKKDTIPSLHLPQIQATHNAKIKISSGSAVRELHINVGKSVLMLRYSSCTTIVLGF
jgi:THAP domain